MKRGITGECITSSSSGEAVRAFVPKPLPPKPPLVLEGGSRDRIDRALLALGRLDSVTTLLPDRNLFLYSYIRKEAVLSSQIEGTQSTLTDLLLYEIDEIPGVPLDDVQEVSNYVAAFEYGLKRLQEGFPLSNRLLREMHQILLSKGRGASKQPGEFRTSQNWIGGTRPGDAHFVPPPPNRVMDCMGDLERFLHDEPERTPALIKAALAHVQFETIHPFLDGNGRLGRLLITLVLCVEKVLKEPLLYLSLHFKRHRGRYYALLDEVRTNGDWEEWVEFFARAVEGTAGSAVTTAISINNLFREDRRKIEESLQRKANSAIRVHEAMQRRAIASASLIATRTKLSLPTVIKALDGLESLGIVRESTGRERYRAYVYDRYLEILDTETDNTEG